MTLTADQYSQIAQGYEKAAADPLVAAEKRADLTKKAEWFWFLAQREKATHGSGRGNGNTDPTFAEPKSRERSWRSIAPFLTTLWVTGAAVYLVGSLLFTNAVNLFGTEERKTLAPELKQAVESVKDQSRAEQGNEHAALAERPHAISPDQPTYESPTLTLPSSPLAQEEFASTAPSPRSDPSFPPLSQPVEGLVGKSKEVLIVRAAATIRNGPSTSAKKIGTATAGAQLEVKGREKEWVQFVDPSSGNTGWIQSSLLIPPTGNEVGNLTLPTPVDTPPVKPTKPKIVKKKPSATAQVPQRPRTYADLPPDEEFLPLPRRRGPGILSRRRMLRDGLMSPGFLPPE